MIKILKNPKQIISLNTKGKNYKKGLEQNELEVYLDRSIIIENDKIVDIISNSNISKNKYDEIIDLSGKIILPGLIDCHTHTAFAGNRANEFRSRLIGKSYEEIANNGGGINSTVLAVRNTSFDDLVKIVTPRIFNFISQGVTTLEIKSGYGLSYYDEIKLLQVIKHLDEKLPIDISATFLGAHTFPPEYKNEKDKYVDIIISEMLPYISDNKLAEYCDAFCEETAFNKEQIARIFENATKLGLKLKLHTNQFNSIGGIDLALNFNCFSVDHLEVASNAEIEKIASSEMVAVLLPGVSFFLNYGYAPARSIIDKGGMVALSTDFNPGSSNILNLSMIMSLAAIKMGMTIEETICAVTINAAKALDRSKNIGSIEIGKKADFSIFKAEEYSEIVYNVGQNLNCMTIKNGNTIYSSNKEENL